MNKLSSWLGAAVIIVIAFGNIYAIVQQAQRSDANWPQIQMAEDTAAELNRSANATISADSHVSMDKSLASFTIIYDKSGQVVGGTGYLGNQIPSAPIGILKASEGREYHAVTWQPKAGVRIAGVTVTANKYYVLSGRSLKEVEKNESTTFRLTLLSAFASLVILAGMFVLSQSSSKK